MAGKVFIGVSGWRYTPWRGHFYPQRPGCYFDNTDKRHAPDNARELMALLGESWRPTKP